MSYRGLGLRCKEGAAVLLALLVSLFFYKKKCLRPPQPRETHSCQQGKETGHAG
jgi:hypothetical protein